MAKSVEEYQENDDVEAFVLFIDFKEACLELSLLPLVLKNLKKLNQTTTTTTSSFTDVAKIDQRLNATILVTKKDFILLSLELHAKGAIAYMPARLHYNDVQEIQRYQVGERLAGIVKEHFDETTVFVSNVKNEKVYVSKQQTSVEPLQKWVTVEIGKIYDGHVLEIENLYLNVFIKQNQKARVHISELDEESFFSVEGRSPLNSFLPEQNVRVKVIGFTKLFDGTRVAECTMQKRKIECVKNKKRNIYFKEKFIKGQKVYVFVDYFKNNRCYVDVNPEWKGYIHVPHLSTDAQVLERPEDHFKKGQVYAAYVTSVQNKEKRLTLSLLSTNDRKTVRIRNDSVKSEPYSDTGVTVGVKRKRAVGENSSVGVSTEVETKRLKTDELPRLKVSGGFNWTPSRFSMKNLMEVGLENETNVNTLRQTTLLDDDEKETGDVKCIKNDDDDTKNFAKSKFEADKIEEQELIQVIRVCFG